MSMEMLKKENIFANKIRTGKLMTALNKKRVSSSDIYNDILPPKAWKFFQNFSFFRKRFQKGVFISVLRYVRTYFSD
jgi:hypothetical protein